MTEHQQTPGTETPQFSQPISTGDWVVTLLIAAIPLVNIIMLLVWAFGDGTHPSKANWAKAALIWMAISIGLWMLFFLFFGGLAMLSTAA